MNSFGQITFEINKDGRNYHFSVPFGAPYTEVFAVLEEFLSGIKAQQEEQKKAQEAQAKANEEQKPVEEENKQS